MRLRVPQGEGALNPPLLIDLFCGSFGWSAGWRELGGRVIGFDLEHEAHHGPVPRGAQLVIQDVRTIDGAQFKDASLIVASSPCQEFSYRAMPWKRAKALGPPLLGMELFAQAFRIQREAIAAAGHFIPMVQENVRGAQKYVGRARWHYGSFYLWGDVPALMPITFRVTKVSGMGAGWRPPGHPDHRPGLAFNTHAERAMMADDAVKVGGPRGDDWFTHHNRPEFEDRATKNNGGSWFNVAHGGVTHRTGNNPARGEGVDGVKQSGISGERDNGKGDRWFQDGAAQHGSKSSARKAASAMIARIPFALASHIARVYFPR